MSSREAAKWLRANITPLEAYADKFTGTSVDHCHKETLLDLDANTPVFAVEEAAKLIQGWKHFRNVTTVGSFGAEGDTDWRSTSLPPLPEWIGVSRVLQAEDVLNYHTAIMITFNNRHKSAKTKLAGASVPLQNGSRKRHHKALEPDEDEETAEAIIYTPHGISAGDLELIPQAQPSISTLAFLHGLHNVRIGTTTGRTALQLNLGVHNGLKAQRVLNASYWIGTHDEVKKGGGLVSWFLQRDVISLKNALQQERELRKKGDESMAEGELGATLDAFDGTNWLELSNGESRTLL